MTPPRIVVLAGGVGGGRFVLGVRQHCRDRWPDGHGGTLAEITVIVNTGDDAWVAGLRVTPDLDSITYTLAGVSDTQRGWGRTGETERVSAELTAYGVGWPWFTLGDLDLGTHIARTSLLKDGLPLSAATERLLTRWDLGVTLLPMTDSEVETRVVIESLEAAGEEVSLHFEEWWVRHRAAVAPVRFEQPGVEDAMPSPGVLEAIALANVVLIAPSNPVVSVGPILAIPGLREAIRFAEAPVVGVSPIIGAAAVRGHAEICLTTIGVEVSASGVARHYGARSDGGLLDGWLVDSTDADQAEALTAGGIPTRARPLWMTDAATTAVMVGEALELAEPR